MAQLKDMNEIPTNGNMRLEEIKGDVVYVHPYTRQVSREV